MRVRRRRVRFAVPAAQICLALIVLVGLPGARSQDQPAQERGPSFEIPYRLTDTNHFLVRAKINGKGPFNLLVDTGAPALFISTEAAAKVGLKADPGEFWAKIDVLEFEGGARLEGVKGRVEDPFQLVSMNALGLPGASIDGMLGYTILGRYRITLDPETDRMIWAATDFVPPDPPVAQDIDERALPPEIRMLNAIGPMAKLFAAVAGKQPEEQRIPAGYLGIELEELRANPDDDQDDSTTVRVTAVWPESPADEAGIQPGDQIRAIDGRRIARITDAQAAVAELKPGQSVRLVIDRQPEAEIITVTAAEGF